LIKQQYEEQTKYIDELIDKVSDLDTILEEIDYLKTVIDVLKRKNGV
jgi:hypothetical protein